jgi:hypothetical protein
MSRYTFTPNIPALGQTQQYSKVRDNLDHLKYDNCPRNHIDGFTLSNNATDANNDIDIAVGECADSTNAT